jgi:hypothetical protein
MIKKILLLMFFLQYNIFFAANADEADKLRGFLMQCRTTCSQAEARCLQDLPRTCEYKKGKNHKIPACFVAQEIRVAHSCLADEVYFSSSVTDFAGALDSLLIAPTPDSKWAIECSFATGVAQLQGIRAMTGNDHIFNLWCTTHLSLEHDGSRKVAVPGKFVNSPGQTMQELLANGSYYLPGARVYFGQLLQDENNLSIFIKPGMHPLALLVLQILFKKYFPHVYCAKHEFGEMSGLNTICMGPGAAASGEFVFFNNEGEVNVGTEPEIIDMLITAMNADVVESDPVKANLLNSIGYSNIEAARKAIRSNVSVISLNFAEIRYSISQIILGEFMYRIFSDQSFREALLQAYAACHK